MEDIFIDISKYYAAQIVANVLTIGRIVYQDDAYQFTRDDVRGPFELVESDDDVTRIIHVIEVRSIHKGMGTAIYSRRACPLILWNRNYQDHMYFDVIDIKNVFSERAERAEFASVLAESLRDDELFPPLVRMAK